MILGVAAVLLEIMASGGVRARRVGLGLGLTALACEGSPPIAADEEAQEISEDQLCDQVFDDGVGKLRVCQSRSLLVEAPAVERAVIVIHGSGLDARRYHDNTLAAAVAAGVDLDSLDLVAPQFFEAIPAYPPPEGGDWAGYYDWPRAWRYGDEASSHPRSSYAVIDALIGQLVATRPNLQVIVVAGQSAGGQFVDHYASGTGLAPAGVHLRFWAANPGIYLWHGPERPEPVTCSVYDDYPYGLVDRNAYMAGTEVDTLRRNLLTRDIHWSVGAEDTEPVGACRSNTQGANRRERWANHGEHVADLCAGLVAAGEFELDCALLEPRHVELADCGHGHVCSWATAEARELLFGPL